MQTRDHSLLGRYVLTYCGINPDTICRRLFLFGCIEPDWNLITYTRGSIKYQFLHGHNAENARKHFLRLTEKLLHDVFVDRLHTQNMEGDSAGEFTHEHYLSEQRSFRTDCRYIIGASLVLCYRLSVLKAHNELDPMFVSQTL